jgi:hypothetical protein
MNIFAWLKRLLFGTPRTPPGTSPFAPGCGPARLIIMRHAEKTGDNSDRHLSLPGQKRAEQLATYIPQQFGTPDFLFAAKSSKKSQRPYDTIAPLANALGLKINETFDDDETDALVDHLGQSDKYNGKSGVISWRHSDIPALMAALGAPDASFPQAWDPAVFNLILDISFRDGTSPKVRQVIEPF